MNTYIIEAFAFPHVLGKDNLIKVTSEKDLDTVLHEVKAILEAKNPMYEYDVIGSTVEEFIKNIKPLELGE